MSTDRAPRVHYGWIALGAVTVILLAPAGVRSSFGGFIKPMEAEFGWERPSLSITASPSLSIDGAVGPLVGRLAVAGATRGAWFSASPAEGRPPGSS